MRTLYRLVMKKESWALLLSSVAVLISLVAICVACPHKAELGFDYQGVIVGVLSLLVTILIGWQIYTFIDINKKSKELEEAKTAALISTERNNALTTNAISDFYYYILLKSDPLGVEYRFLDYRISSLYHFSNIGEIETCNTIVKVLLEMIVVPEDIKVLESGKNRILMLLTKVKDTDKIIGYEELVSRIARLGIMPKQSK